MSLRHLFSDVEYFEDHLIRLIRIFVFLTIAAIVSFWMVSSVAVHEIDSYTTSIIMKGTHETNQH